MLGGYIGDLEAGDEFEPVRFTVSAYECAEYAHGVEEASPWFYEPSPPFDRQVRLPTMVHADRIKLLEANCLAEQRMLRGEEADDARIHYEYSAIHHYPVFAGDELIVSGRVADRYWKRGREYLDYDVELRTPTGRLVTSYHDSSLLRYRVGGE